MNSSKKTSKSDQQTLEEWVLRPSRYAPRPRIPRRKKRPKRSSVVQQDPSGLPLRLVPFLPNEILSLIVAAAPRESLPSLLAASRTFAEIARPLLFRLVTISKESSLYRLLAISQTLHLADLVRTLRLGDSSTDFGAYSWNETIPLISNSLLLLRNLLTFKIDASLLEGFHLNKPLSLAIFTHPSLVELGYGKLWNLKDWDPEDDTQTVVQRVRTDPIVVPRLSYPASRSQNVLAFDSLLLRIDSLGRNYHLQIHTLDISVEQEDGEEHPLHLLAAANLPGLKVVRLLFDTDGPSRFPDFVCDSDWLSLFLAAHQLVEKIIFWAGSDDRGGGADVFIPYESLLRATGGAQSVAIPLMARWCGCTPLKEVKIDLRTRKDGSGARDVVGLSLWREWSNEDRLDVFDARHLREIAADFPHLQDLEFKGGFWVMDFMSAPFLEAILSFSRLVSIYLPTCFLSRPYLSGCSHLFVAAYDALQKESELSADERVQRQGTLIDDEDGTLLHRLLGTGCAARRDTLKDFINSFSGDWIGVAEKILSLERVEVEATIHNDAEGSVGWSVERRKGGEVRLRECSSSRFLDQPRCTCDMNDWNVKTVYRALEDEEPLFDQPVRRRVRTSLDRFLDIPL